MIRFLSISVFLLISSQAFCTHILGGGITWEQIGIDTFKVTATIYRDCNGINLSATPVTAFSNCGSKRLNTTRNGGEDITPVCEGQCSRCRSRGCSFKYGIEKIELTTIFITTQWRKNGCCDVTFTWSQCCRTSSITTGAASQDLYVEALMYICDTINPINSPKWVNNPPLITCLGRDVIFNLGAEKANSNDSLVYSFAEPLTSATGKTTWSNNYSYDKPMYYLGFPKTGLKFPRGLHLDSFNGVFMMRPMKTEYTLLTYKVELYRNGVRRAVTTKETPFIVIKCPNNNPPVLSGVNCSQPKPDNFEINMCANNLNIFEICSSDKDKEDTVRIEYSTDIKNAVIEYNKNDPRPKLIFKWKPELSDTGKTFNLLVKAIDDACPVNGVTSRFYTIRVIDYKLNYSVASFSDSCNNANFYFKSIDTNKMKCVTWQHKGKFISPCLDSPILDTVTFNFKKPGLKHIKLHIPTFNGCNIIDSIPHVVPKNITYFSKLNDTSVCARDTIELKALLHNPKGKTSITWNTGLKTNDLLSSQKIGLSYSDSLIIVNYKDSICSNSDSAYITVNKPHILSFLNNIGVCHADSDTFKFEQQYYFDDLDSNATYTWLDSLGNLIESTSNPYFNFPYNGQYTFKSTDGFGCTEIDTIQYTLFDPLEDFYLADSLLCINALDTIRANAVKEGKLSWYDNTFGNMFLLARDTNSMIVKLSSKANYELGYVHDKTGCSAVKTVTAYPVSADKPKFVKVDSMCANDTFSVSTHLRNSTWAFDSIAQTGLFQVIPLNYGYTIGIMPILYTGIDSNNCRVTDTAKLKLKETPVTKIWATDTILKNEIFYPRPSIKQKHNYKFYWEFGDPVFMTFNDYQPQVSFDTLGSFRVKLTVTNNDNGCATSTIKAMDIIVQRFPTGINSNFFNSKIYPNPTHNNINIESDFTIKTITIYSVDGRKMLTEEIESKNHTVDLNSFVEGNYFLQITTDQGVSFKKIIKTK
jgi:hypothetical protein